MTLEASGIRCQNGCMAEKSNKRKGTSKDHDFAVLAREVVEQAIGEKLDGSALVDPRKDAKSLQAGQARGAPGGVARSEKLSPEKRREIARKAAAARWLKRKLEADGQN